MHDAFAGDTPEKDSEAPRQILFVTGMHRSATSAFAGSLALLGAALPTRMLGANFFNPKGYFESESVVEANDRLLGEMQRHWNDCRPVVQPAGVPRQTAEDNFARLLRTEFGPGPIVALKDPRVSLLAPIWIDAARRTGARPSFVVMLRDPVTSAASIMRRDGLGEEAAIALWLRYMFDAEHHSRDHPRIIVGAEAFMGDPVATLDRVGAALGLHWPTAPDAARDALTAFIDPSLLDARQDVQIPLAGFAHEVHTALADLSGLQGGDETAARARIDRLRADFDAMCPDIHGRMVFDQLGKAVTRKWDLDGANGQVRALAAQLEESKAQTAAAAAAREEAHKIHVALEHRVHAAEAEREAAVRAFVQAQTDLARARRRREGYGGT